MWIWIRIRNTEENMTTIQAYGTDGTEPGTCNEKVAKKMGGHFLYGTCSPVEREMKDTDMKAVPGPEESHSATNGREELKIKTIN